MVDPLKKTASNVETNGYHMKRVTQDTTQLALNTSNSLHKAEACRLIRVGAPSRTADRSDETNELDWL